jgi:hypothetical protein
MTGDLLEKRHAFGSIVAQFNERTESANVEVLVKRHAPRGKTKNWKRGMPERFDDLVDFALDDIAAEPPAMKVDKRIIDTHAPDARLGPRAQSSSSPVQSYSDGPSLPPVITA